MLEPIPFAGYVEIDEIENAPVAWMMKSNDLDYVSDYIMFKTPERKDKISHHAIPLYTHPAEHELGIAEAIGFEKGYQVGLRKAQEK